MCMGAHTPASTHTHTYTFVSMRKKVSSGENIKRTFNPLLTHQLTKNWGVGGADKNEHL